jgi:hypothetical protein
MSTGFQPGPQTKLKSRSGLAVQPWGPWLAGAHQTCSPRAKALGHCVNPSDTVVGGMSLTFQKVGCFPSVRAIDGVSLTFRLTWLDTVSHCVPDELIIGTLRLLSSCFICNPRFSLPGPSLDAAKRLPWLSYGC